MKGTLNRKLEDPIYRAEFENRQRFFDLEIQILLAMEDKGWTYNDLARAVCTSRQNIWRDLKNGGLHKASLDRVARMAEALGLRVHHLLLSRKNEKKILPILHKLLKAA